MLTVFSSSTHFDKYPLQVHNNSTIPSCISNLKYPFSILASTCEPFTFTLTSFAHKGFLILRALPSRLLTLTLISKLVSVVLVKSSISASFD